MLTFLFIFLFLGVLSFFWVFLAWVILSGLSIIPLELRIPGIFRPRIFVRSEEIFTIWTNLVEPSGDAEVSMVTLHGRFGLGKSSMITQGRGVDYVDGLGAPPPSALQRIGRTLKSRDSEVLGTTGVTTSTNWLQVVCLE